MEHSIFCMSIIIICRPLILWKTLERLYLLICNECNRRNRNRILWKLKYLNLISEDNILLLDRESDESPASNDVMPKNILSNNTHIIGTGGGSPAVVAATQISQHYGGLVINPDIKRADVKVSNGRFVTLEFPYDITTQEIDRLIANLELWKD